MPTLAPMTSSGRGSRTPWAPPGRPLPAAASATDGLGGSELESPPPVLPRRGRLLAILVTARPRQWIKNGLVIAAAGAAGALGRDDVLGRVVLACLAFCLISAGTYALNDSRDVAEDRRHPRKRYRPVAAYELERRDAVVIGAGWLLAGLALCFSIRPLLAVVGAGYVALTLTYTLLWRHVVVFDIIAVAGGFVLRALAGGVAAPVALSIWFVVVVSAVALFVAAGKRQAELLRTTSGSARIGGRSVLAHYTPSVLWLLLAASGVTATVAYCLWAIALPDIDGVPWRMLTLIPFTACLLRYWVLVRGGAGEAPEEVVLGDRVLAAGGLMWLLLFALAVHAAG